MIVGSFVVGSLWHHLTGGFRLNKIVFDLPENSEWEQPLTDDFEKVQTLLDQKFIYLGKGRQSYVFESEDQQYVIKFLRYHLIRPRLRYYLLQYPQFFSEFRKYQLRRKKQQFSCWMDSYVLAHKNLKEETGILYMHLTKTKNHLKNIQFKDKIGRTYTVNADTTGFMIQKKVDLFKDRIMKLVRNKDFTHLQRVIRAYFQTVIKRQQKGIQNKDHSWVQNYGIIGFDEVYEIDAGRYSASKPCKTNSDLELYLMRYAHPLEIYFQQHFPEFHSEFLKILKEEAQKEC